MKAPIIFHIILWFVQPSCKFSMPPQNAQKQDKPVANKMARRPKICLMINPLYVCIIHKINLLIQYQNPIKNQIKLLFINYVIFFIFYFGIIYFLINFIDYIKDF